MEGSFIDYGFSTISVFQIILHISLNKFCIEKDAVSINRLDILIFILSGAHNEKCLINILNTGDFFSFFLQC